MKSFYRVLFALSCIIATGCSHYTINSEGFIRPPNGYKFSYRNKVNHLTSTELVDTNAIYVMRNNNFQRNSDEYKQGDSYFRFYADGKFKKTGIKTTDSIIIEDVNNINVGIVGYYKLKGRVIKLQFYSDFYGGSDILKIGRISEDGELVLLHSSPSETFGIGYSEKGVKRKIEKEFFNPGIYKKTKLNGMAYIRPNW